MLFRQNKVLQSLIRGRQLYRPFSTLLVPLKQASEVPALVNEGFPLTKAYFSELEAQYKQFNDQCVVELKEMNQTRITNIIDSNGIDGWEESGDLDYLSKTFDFNSFEQCQAFVQSVGKYCETKDHHPEWNSTNDGQSVSVRLTSHFANNKVSLFDFELAQHMNTVYGENNSTFTMFPKTDESQWVNLCVAVGSFVTCYSLFNYYSMYQFETNKQRGIALKDNFLEGNSQALVIDKELANVLAKKV